MTTKARFTAWPAAPAPPPAAAPTLDLERLSDEQLRLLRALLRLAPPWSWDEDDPRSAPTWALLLIRELLRAAAPVDPAPAPAAPAAPAPDPPLLLSPALRDALDGDDLDDFAVILPAAWPLASRDDREALATIARALGVEPPAEPAPPVAADEPPPPVEPDPAPDLSGLIPKASESRPDPVAVRAPLDEPPAAKPKPPPADEPEPSEPGYQPFLVSRRDGGSRFDDGYSPV